MTDLERFSGDFQGLRSLFLRHQEALVGLLFVHALADLEEFGRRLSVHMRSAEKTLGANVRLDEEHRRMERMFQGFLARVRDLSEGPGTSRAVIKIVEDEKDFLMLLDRHREREVGVILDGQS